MADNANTPDEDGTIPHLENFLRPFEKQDRETLDSWAKQVKESIATRDAEIAELKRQIAEQKNSD